MAPTRFLTCNANTFSPPVSDSVKHSITCAVFQQPWPVRKHKVYHILEAKSLVSTPAWGDPEDKCSFPEWFIMLRLHYLAFGVWQNKRSPSPPLFKCNSKPNILYQMYKLHFKKTAMIWHSYAEFKIHVTLISIIYWMKTIQLLLNNSTACYSAYSL